MVVTDEAEVVPAESRPSRYIKVDEVILVEVPAIKELSFPRNARGNEQQAGDYNLMLPEPGDYVYCVGFPCSAGMNRTELT